MAEVAGLVIGAAALVGLISTCKQALDAIDHARSEGRDFEILHLRLQMQKHRFRRWGTLGAIFGLFNQGEKIAQRHDKGKLTTATRNRFRMKKGGKAMLGRWVLQDRVKFLVDQVEKLTDDLGMTSKSVKYKHLRRWKRDTRHLLRLNKMFYTKAEPTSAYAREQALDALTHFEDLD